ncbi:MAG: rhomboid family intramembrane serine protease [Opitutae bacterium]|nr:rhomboid family intramembrane serine protease [Opitutae bacterium]
MRSDYPRQTTSMLTWIICALVAAFVMQFTFERWLHSNIVTAFFALSPYALAKWHIWTFVTYAFLHADVLHLLLNGLGLYLIGRELAPLLGSRRFLSFYAAAAIGGGLLWIAVHAAAGGGTVLMGASSAVAALFILFACIYPEREVTFLLFFVVPITLKPKLLAWILVGMETLGFLFSELPGGSFDTGIAHSAHLGGMLTGWLYHRLFHANNGWDRAASPVIQLPAWLRKRQKSKASQPAFKIDLKGPSNLRSEVDRILDKINSEGFGSLTEQEKRLLDEARDLLSRH